MYRRIMVPLDGSQLSEAALDQLAHLAGSQTEVILLRVVAPPSVDAPAPVPTNPTALAVLVPAVEVATEEATAELRAAEYYLAEKEAGLARRGIRARFTAIEDSHPAEVIVTQAEAEQADVIVMSTHGRSGIVRWMLGSVADQVLHSCLVPLLLVRPGRPIP